MSRNDKEKTWAEIASRINMELSKTSEHKPDWTLGPADDTLGPANDDLRKILDWPRSMDVRKITPAEPLSVESSAVAYLSKLFQGNETADYAIIDLGTGQNWLTSRLYIFAIMLERMRGLRCFVFLETSGEVDQRFLGIASPREVRWALARRYPWLEVAFAKAYSYTTDPDSGIDWVAYDPKFGILSGTGGLDLGLAQAVVYEFLTRIQQTSTDTPSNPDDGEWEFFTTEGGKPLWEHARWLDATRLRQDLGDILQQGESTWVIESPDISHTELARSILRCKSPFVALVDEEKRFKSLIDRQDLLERTVANQ